MITRDIVRYLKYSDMKKDQLKGKMLHHVSRALLLTCFHGMRSIHKPQFLRCIQRLVAFHDLTHNRHRLYYFHVNGSIGIVQKIDYEITPDLGCTTLKTSKEVGLDNPSVCLPVCLSVCPSVRLSGCLTVCLAMSLFPRALTGVRVNRSS